jgi:hypothetical protein
MHLSLNKYPFKTLHSTCSPPPRPSRAALAHLPVSHCHRLLVVVPLLQAIHRCIFPGSGEAPPQRRSGEAALAHDSSGASPSARAPRRRSGEASSGAGQARPPLELPPARPPAPPSPTCPSAWRRLQPRAWWGCCPHLRNGGGTATAGWTSWGSPSLLFLFVPSIVYLMDWINLNFIRLDLIRDQLW